MFEYSLARYWAAFVVLILGTGLVAAAKIPGADDANAYTEHARIRDLLDFNQRTLTEAYKAVGKRDPKWDAPAIAFLDGMARYFTYVRAEPFYVPAPPTTVAELAKLGLAAVNTGCDDPLVLYCHAAILEGLGQTREARPLLERAARGFGGSKYAPCRIQRCFGRLQEHLDKAREQAEYQRCEQAIIEQAALALASGDLPKRDRRFVFEFVWDSLKSTGVDRAQKAYELAQKQNGSDPWMLNMLGGEYHTKAAWEARGTGWADSVTEEGSRGFEKHLDQARECFLKAHQLRLDFPEPATRMIGVVMGGQAAPGETLRTWFDRAAAAQVDYMPAYTALLWAYRPRWGGSHDLMYQFGVECLQSGRFDTIVPYRLIAVLEDIRSEMRGSYEYWMRLGIYESVRECYAKYAEKGGARRDAYRSQNAAVAWRLGRYEDARQLLEQLGDRLSAEAFSAMGGWSPLASSQIHAMTGSHAAALKEAEAAAARGQFDAAAKAYGEVAGKLKQGDPAQPFVRARIADMDVESRFATGQWIDLKPDVGAGWHLVNGRCRVDANGNVIGTADANGFLLVCGADFGSRYELETQMEFLPGEWDEPSAGPVVLHANERSNYSLLLYRAYNQLLVKRGPDVLLSYKAASGARCLIRVAVRDEVMDASVNGTAVAEGYPIGSEHPRVDTHIGLGTHWGAPGRTVRFTSVRIRRLPGTP